MRRLKPKQEATRAAIWLIVGTLFAVAPVVGVHYDQKRALVWLWVTLLLATFPVVGRGAAYLANSRGYPSAGGCGLCVIGYVVSGFVGTASHNLAALTLGVVFMVLFPTVVLLALPDKSQPPY